MKLCMTARFSRKFYLHPKKKWAKNGAEKRFFKFVEKFGHKILLNSF